MSCMENLMGLDIFELAWSEADHRNCDCTALLPSNIVIVKVAANITALFRAILMAILYLSASTTYVSYG